MKEFGNRGREPFKIFDHFGGGFGMFGSERMFE